MGLLKVDGSLDINQFWPGGTSDADTAKVTVNGANAFRFQPHPGAAFKVTHVFEKAKVRGSTTKPAIDSKKRITIRLQGIDAPELHYRPSPLKKGVAETVRTKFKTVNKEYRQNLGESAANSLRKLLAGPSSASIPCTVTTQVDSPNEVFDTYGRFIGDIVVKHKGANLDLNIWLVEQGWAFPTFYTSMQPEEIQAFLKATTKGKKKGRIWAKLTKKIPTFDPSLVFVKGGPFEANADNGPVCLPKLFRRQTTWFAYKKAGATSKDFKPFLKEQRNALLLTNDFLENGIHAASPHFIDEFLKADGTFSLLPEGMVFKEDPSSLVDDTGKKITSF
jgi:endonuclease YncB( thermonuclease family)